MSLANRCDRCGSLIPGQANFDKEDFDAAILSRGELILSFEDLCPNCLRQFNTMVQSFNGQEEKSAPEPQEQEPEIKDAPKPKPKKKPEAKINREPVEGVVKQIPIELKRPNTDKQ